MKRDAQCSSAVANGVKRKKKKWTREDLELTLLGLPTFVWYVLFSYLPMFGILIAFKQYKVVPKKSFLYSLLHSEFVGFKNFSFFIKNKSFMMLLRNTLCYNIVFIILGIVIPVTLALLINELYSKKASKCYQTMMFFPHFLSWVVVSYFVFAFLSPDKGLMNKIVIALGGEKIMWYSEPTYWPFILVFVQIWRGIGYNCIVYLATILGIDRGIYEAASIDGAGQQDPAGVPDHPAPAEANHHHDHPAGCRPHL